MPDRLDDPLDLLGALAELPGGPFLICEALRRVLAGEGLAGLSENVGRDRLDVAAQLLAVAAHEVDARLGRRQLNPMLLGAGRKSLLQARDLAVVALDQRADLDFADGSGARELGLARGQVDPVAAQEQPDADRTDRGSQDKEDNTHRDHRLPIRERSTVTPPPDVMHALRHGFIP